MALAFTVGLGPHDWDPNIGGWRCQALSVPGAHVDAMFANENRVDTTRYQVDTALGIVRWTHGTDAPSTVIIAVKLMKELSTHELTVRWKQLAIIMPVITAVVAGVVGHRVPKSPVPPPPSLWTIKGAVEQSDSYRHYEVDTSMMPPDLRLKPDNTFEGQVPIVTDSDGTFQLPKLIFTIRGKDGFDTPVVHLIKPGLRPQANAVDYDVEIDTDHQVIDIRKPIAFRRSLSEQPFSPTQTAVPTAALQGR